MDGFRESDCFFTEPFFPEFLVCNNPDLLCIQQLVPNLICHHLLGLDVVEPAIGWWHGEWILIPLNYVQND